MGRLDLRIRVDAGENPFHREFWTGRIDSRPVAAFRICFGVLLLKDALYHLPLAGPLYSDHGILPRAALLSHPYGPFRFSLMDALGPPALVTGFFLAWALVAACLIVGHRTRLAAVLNYLIMVSVQYRNPYVLDGSDGVFRVLGFWSLFLPLADHYSLDALRRRRREQASAGGASPPKRAWALPLRMAQLQVAIIYLATAAHKLRSGVWLSGDALFYTRQLESLMLPLGQAVFAAAPDALLRFGSVAALLIEWAFPFLVLSPIGQPGLRLVGLGLGTALHVGIAATMSIANFSALMISSYWLFAPGEWVEAIARRLRAAWERLVGQLAPARLWRAASASPRLGRWLERAGAWTARAPAGSATAPPERPWPGVARWLLGVALAYVMTSVVWHNLWTVYYPLVPPAWGVAQFPLVYLPLWQQWNMFLAGGRRPDGWVEVVGTFEDGRVLELQRGAPPADEMPRRHWGPWTRWKGLERAVDTMPPVHLQAWAERSCVAPGGAAPGRPVFVELRRRLRMPHAPEAPAEPLQTVVLWRQRCAPGAPRPRT